MEHVIAKEEYQPDNYEDYRYYIECSCGFQTRMARKELAHSQYNSHLIKNGVKEPEKMKTRAELLAQAKQGSTWNPFSK